MFGRFCPQIIRMSRQEILTRLPRSIVCEGRAISNDQFYRIPIDPKYVMKKVPSWDKKYQKETSRNPDVSDCDDAVRIFRGWLSKKDWGNLVAMDTSIDSSIFGPHSLISFLDLTEIDKNGKNVLLFGEPQIKGRIYEKNITKTFTNVKVRI